VGLDGFKVFDPALAWPGRPKPTPRVTVHPGGSFTLNAAAWAALGEPGHVALLYSADGPTIGFRAAAGGAPAAFAVRGFARSATKTVAGQAFVRHYAVPTGPAQRYGARLDGDVLTVALSREGDIVARPRPRR